MLIDKDKSVAQGVDQDEPDPDDSGLPTEEDLENSLDDFGMIERLGAVLTQYITLPAWKNPTKPQRVPGRGRGRPKGSKNKPKSMEQRSIQSQPRILSMLITEDAPSDSKAGDKIVCEEKGIELDPAEERKDLEDGSQDDPQRTAVTDDSGRSDEDDDEQDEE